MNSFKKYIVIVILLLSFNNSTMAEATDKTGVECINTKGELYKQLEVLNNILYNRAKNDYLITSDKYKVYPDRAGVLKLNADVATIYNNFPRNNIYKVIVFNELRQDRYIDIYSGKKRPSVRVAAKNTGTSATIKKIIISDSEFIIHDTGISVGMTVDDLLALYGSLKLGWMDSYLVVSNTQGFNFILDTRDIPKAWFKKAPDLELLPKKTKIRALYLVST